MSEWKLRLLAAWMDRQAKSLEDRIDGREEGGYMETLEVRYCPICKRHSGSYDPCSMRCEIEAYRTISAHLRATPTRAAPLSQETKDG